MSQYLVATTDGREFPTRERCFITELMNDPAVPSVSLARCRVATGVTTELHSLSVAEWYVVAEGNGEMEVDGERFVVGPGDTVAVPAGHPQRIRNSGPTDLVFQCVCQPRFTPAAYTPLEPAHGQA